ncbi:Uncharacterized protein OBRU01_01898 [Operophtera brumata]|uniref:Uncharacterized protein n=1 Tax=Operophtera brumata TaxID=104452 RepID=A0A0L7LU30_OPEBR|nr:Uncharacterized protein OBRU01_01898 [Operophtera brumata]
MPNIEGFPKKLLVATSVVVIITMCLIPAEARTIDHVRFRHERQHDLAHPKNARLRVPERVSEVRIIENRRRPHRKQTLSSTHNAKDTTDPMRLRKNAQAERFKNATKKIIKKLKNTRRFFNEERRVLNETKEYRDGMPSWLPAMNFVDIHFYNYRSTRRPGATVTEKKFMYLMPKLHKSLVEYHEIFKLLLNVEVYFPDDPFFTYNKTRHELIKQTIHRLNGTIAEIQENMISINVTVPLPNGNKFLNSLELRVDAPQCLKNDYIAFRAYGNLLNNWYSEFRCPRGKKVISSNSKCAAYEAKLKEKKDTRGKQRKS